MAPGNRFDTHLRRMMRPFSAEEKEGIESAFRAGVPLRCPTCDVALDERPIAIPTAVSYVRRRTMVSCPACKGHVVLDRHE